MGLFSLVTVFFSPKLSVSCWYLPVLAGTFCVLVCPKHVPVAAEAFVSWLLCLVAALCSSSDNVHSSVGVGVS